MEKKASKTGEVISILSNDTDFTGPATQAMATNPDLIMVWTTQTPAVGIISALRQRGYEGSISASDVISPVAVFEKAGAAMEGVPFPILFSPSLSKDPRAQAFIDAYQAKYDEQPDTYSAQGYTLMYYLTQALNTLEGDPSREDIANALAAVDDDRGQHLRRPADDRRPGDRRELAHRELDRRRHAGTVGRELKCNSSSNN